MAQWNEEAMPNADFSRKKIRSPYSVHRQVICALRKVGKSILWGSTTEWEAHNERSYSAIVQATPAHEAQA